MARISTAQRSSDTAIVCYAHGMARGGGAIAIAALSEVLRPQ